MTYKHLNKQPDHIQKHLNGRRFQKAYKHCNNLLLFCISIWEEVKTCETYFFLQGLHCQETGQLFVPFSKKPSKIRDNNVDQEMKNPDEKNDNEDSMSDLFPGR